MNRFKRNFKIKEPVRLRTKSIANGCYSLYLDTSYNGKRRYEFLRLYLIPEKTPEDKSINDATLKAANAIKAKRILEFLNKKAGIKKSECIPSITEWIEIIIRQKKGNQSSSSISLMQRLLKHIQLYQKSATLADVDRRFCIGFADYLRSASALNSPKSLMPATQFELFNAFSIILNEAVRAEIISNNPMRLLSAKERIKRPESTREYLTPEEVKSMIEAASDNIMKGDDVAAFLFCCFCGLRYSDITRLTWDKIAITDIGKTITMNMKKTGRRIEVPVSDMAAALLPSAGASEEKVFAMPHYTVTLRNLKKIAMAAGIKKKSHSIYPGTLLPH